MILEQTDYRDILKSLLEERKALNPSYSLRAFSRDIGISSSRLSQVLKGTYGFSGKAAKQIAEKLNLNSKEADYFCNLVESSHAKSEQKRKESQRKIAEIRNASTNYSSLDLDYFKVISDWYHFAILELTYLDEFKPDTKWISKALDVEEKLIKLAVKRLFSLELLEERDGTWVDCEGFLATPTDIPSSALRKFQGQLLNKAKNSLAQDSVMERDMTSVMFAVDKDLIPEAKEKIKKFRKEMDLFAQKSKRKNGVYCLAVQFFNLAK